MFPSTIFSIICLLLIVTNTCSLDVVGIKKVSLKPSYDLPLDENQNAVPVSQIINIFIFDRILNGYCLFLENNSVNLLQ